MDNKRNNKIEDILSSLDANQRASAPDFFYTRLKARMEKELNKGRQAWILRHAYALAALAMLLIVNAVVILQKDETDVNTTADNETVQSAAEYYSMNDNTIYDLNPEK
jgi:hypothetical protein